MVSSVGMGEEILMILHPEEICEGLLCPKQRMCKEESCYKFWKLCACPVDPKKGYTTEEIRLLRTDNGGQSLSGVNTELKGKGEMIDSHLDPVKNAIFTKTNSNNIRKV